MKDKRALKMFCRGCLGGLIVVRQINHDATNSRPGATVS